MITMLFALAVVLGLVALPFLFPAFVVAMLTSMARTTLGLRRVVLEVDGFRIAYLDGGSGEPLLLLHGIGADKDNFLLVARQLIKKHRLIIPDLPGFGESDAPATASYRAKDQVLRLRGLLEKLDATRCHIGGNSMGGMLAVAYAATYATETRSLWLLAPGGVRGAKPSELMASIATGRRLQIFARDAREMGEVLRFVMHRPPRIPGFILKTLAARQSASYDLNMAILGQLFSGPWLEDLVSRGFDVPTLIVWGEKDRALDPSGAEVLRALIPGSQVILLPDVGHVPMVEAAKRVALDYENFVATLPA